MTHMSNIFYKILLIFIMYQGGIAKELEVVGDRDLVNLIKNEESVIVLFTKNKCKNCDQFEQVLENLEDDFHQSLNSRVVKAANSPMVSIYDPYSKEVASLIYFRKGIPLLYQGQINEDEILQKFNDNRDPIVKELSDTNFEHLTQASTGSTTGDWLIFFYSNDCIICQRLYAIYEGVGAELKRRMNVARVNRLASGIATGKRFGIQKSPEFIFLRLGKYYHFKAEKYTVHNLVKFIEEEFKDQKGVNVPELSSTSIELQKLFKIIIGDYAFWSSIKVVLLCSIVLILISVIVFKVMSKKLKPVEKTKKSK